MAGLLFGGRTARAMAEIETILDGAESVREVDVARLQKVCAQHGVDLSRHARGGRRRIYARYLEHCLEDCELSDEELGDLAHLGQVLHLGSADVQASHDEVGRTVYGRALSDVLQDLEIDASERAFLTRLRDTIGLPEEDAKEIEAAERWEARKRTLSQASQGDPLFSRSRPRAGTFTGRSESSLEDAVRNALQDARRAIPALHWFEVDRIAGYVGEEGVRNWHVTLSAGLDPEDLA